MAVWGEGGGGRFVGWGPILSVSDPKKMGEILESFSFCCGFKKCVFVENGAIFFCFRPLVHPTGAVRTEKTQQPFSGPKWAKSAETKDFPGLGGRSGRNTCRPNSAARVMRTQ